MSYNLVKFFEQLPDFRRKQGQRYSLPTILSIVIMAILSGENSVRGFANFSQSNLEELSKHFALKHGSPSHVTIGTILGNVSIPILCVEFKKWMSHYFEFSEDQFINGDGKALGSTVANPNQEYQEFIMMVTLFAQQSGLALHLKTFNNGKSGEAEHVRTLIETLGLQGLIFSLDALHCQKKR